MEGRYPENRTLRHRLKDSTAYGSAGDPDPQHFAGSGSAILFEHGCRSSITYFVKLLIKSELGLRNSAYFSFRPCKLKEERLFSNLFLAPALKIQF
jgi:hypothetical protein